MKGIATILLLGSIGCGGCDGGSDAKYDPPSVSEAEFQAVETPGFTSPAGSCDTGISDGHATLRFVLLADDASAIGAELSPEMMTLGFQDSALFGDTQRTATVSTAGSAQLVSDGTKPQLFGVMYENSGSLEGFLPQDLGSLYPDWDLDGTAEGQSDLTQIPGRASDRTRQSRAALAVLINNWKNVARGNDALFGLWEFHGTTENDVVSAVDALTPGDSPWTLSPEVADQVRTEFREVYGTRANVYMAMNHVLDAAYAPSEYDGHAKTLVVFVDGPDDLRIPQFDVDSVIHRAADLGVRIFMVHLDSSQEVTSMDGTPVFRDDPRYWNERVTGMPVQQPCTGDDQCKNFERCRVPQAYGTAQGGPVEITSNGETYCLPERDPVNGRFGPIHDYSRIACETGGGYMYVREPSGLRPRIDWLPFAMDALWEVDTVIDVIENQEVDANETYHLQTTFNVTLGDVVRSYEFSQTGEPISADDGADTRAVLFNAE